MSKPTKAQIKYSAGKGKEATESTLRFHSVISEEHEITTEITKYPVQSGFNVSQNAIKKNRKVTISGLVSNHLVIGAEEFHEYGGNNSKVMFETLKNLVRQATPCEVNTNYGDYSPVLFTKFKTKLIAGKTDIMEFTLTGEEVQVGLTLNQTAPTLLVFTPLTDAERAARVDELLAAGLVVTDKAVITEAPVDMNESFQVETTNTNGETSITTYERNGYDPSTGQYSHKMHTSDTDAATSDPTPSINWFAIMQEEGVDRGLIEALPDINLEAGASTATACLADGATGLALDTASGLINTAVGELTKTIYGAAYGIFGVNGDTSLGQTLLALGVDCLVAGTIGTVDPELNSDDFQDNDIPTMDDALSGAASIGDSITTNTLGVAAPTTLTKISPPSGNVSFFGDLI